MAFTYPLPLVRKHNIDEWLDTLPRITASNTFDPVLRTCTSCATAPFADRSFLDESDSIVLLLHCGCRWHRQCLTELLSLEVDNDDHCLRCGFQLFEQWTFEAWIDTLKRIPMEAVWKGEVENECGICRFEYKAPAAQHLENADDIPEQPIALPCNHTFGESCLKKWLSPNDGKGNTCPTCRRRLFPPWPSDDPAAPAEGIPEFEITEHGLQRRQNDDEMPAILRRLEERTHWQRFIVLHQRVHNLSLNDMSEDYDWMDQQIEEMDLNYRGWVDESRWQLAERRARIRHLLLDRVIERTRERSLLVHVEMCHLEQMEAYGDSVGAAELAREYGLPVL